MRLGLSHLNEHKFRYGFNDKINPICICSDIESINHFFLDCPELIEARQALRDNLQSIDITLFSQNESLLAHLRLYDDPKRSSNVNAFFLNSTMKFILSSRRLYGSLLNEAYKFFDLVQLSLNITY